MGKRTVYYMESDNSHTAYRIPMPKPHAAYAYRVYGILALVSMLVPLSDRLLRLDLSRTHYSWLSSSDILEKERYDLFTLKLPLHTSAYTAGCLLSRVVMSRRCTATARG